MGVRLYPILKEGVTLEQFLNLPEGTQARFEAHEAKRPSGSDFMAYDEWHKGMDDDMEAINCFELNGWGKFYPCDWQKDGEFVSCSGKELDKAKWENLLLTNGERFGIEREERVKIVKGQPNFTDMLDGVHWG